MPSGDKTAEMDKVRELQVKLYLAAKRSPGRRFHAFWDRIHRRDVLQRAWLQVREHRGAAGLDASRSPRSRRAGSRRSSTSLKRSSGSSATLPGP
jgi:hypothetical protein